PILPDLRFYRPVTRFSFTLKLRLHHTAALRHSPTVPTPDTTGTISEHTGGGHMTERGGFTDRLSSILSTPTPQPATWFSILLAAVAVIAGITATWARYITAISTLIHETGHALAAILTGGGVHVIRIHDHESGVAYTWYWSRLSSVISSFAGY